MNDYGERLDDATVRFERLLPGPIERVWAYLTESDKRARWLCGGEMQLEPGGRMEMKFHNRSLSSAGDIARPERFRDLPEKMSFDGRVVHCEPPRLLAYTWEFEGAESEVTCELSQQNGKVLLVLTHRRLSSSQEVLDVSTGWHTHLDILEDVLEGRELRPFYKTQQALQADYEQRLA